MTEKSPTVTCSRCSGSGKEPLSREHAEILAELAKGPASAAYLAPLFDASRTAVNNRLEWLRLHGLATRQKVGREWAYSVPPPKRQAAA